jgi:mycofactocin precursor
MAEDSVSVIEQAAAVTDEAQETPEDEYLIAEELLVEEISIDGMCGVY